MKKRNKVHSRLRSRDPRHFIVNNKACYMQEHFVSNVVLCRSDLEDVLNIYGSENNIVISKIPRFHITNPHFKI